MNDPRIQAAALLAKYGRSLDKGPRCSVERSGQRELIEHLIRLEVTSARIADILREEFSIDILGTTISRHRRKECRCR